MGRSRLLAAFAVAAVPVYFLTAWIGLQSVDQPHRVDPGQTFTATVEALVYLDGGPVPLDMPPASDLVTLRLGVLAPTDWAVDAMRWKAGGATGVLQPAPDETDVYQVYYAAPPGYAWRAFRGGDRAAAGGETLRFGVDLKAGAAVGLHKVVYMTWNQPPYMGEKPGGTPPPSSAPSAAPSTDVYPWPYPNPSVIETTVAVGDVGPAPQVVAFEPADGAADVARTTDVRITFDRDMDLASLRDGGVRLFGGPVWYREDRPAWHTGTPLDPDFVPPPWGPSPVPMQVFYNSATKTAVIDPLEPLLGHTVYTVLVTDQAKATDGVPVDQVRTASFLTEPGPEPPFFSDVPPDHRFRVAIETLYRAGIVGGFPDGTFRPDDSVTRAQMSKMLVLLLGIHTPEPDPVPPFTDLPPRSGDPALDYISEATRAGITEGFDDGTFRPDDTVTRIQLTRMIVRASQAWLSAPGPGYSAGFADVAPADQSFVDWAFYNDLVDGKAPGRFDPWSTATRGHAGRILYGVWQRMNGGVPVPANEPTGIAGMVTLGPLSPVEIPGVPNSRPYEATIVIKTEDGAYEVARVRSGPDGSFKAALDPGIYLVEPQPGTNRLPYAPPQVVKVEDGAYTRISIAYDTGIR